MINSETSEASRRHLCSSLLSHYLRLHRAVMTPGDIAIPLKAWGQIEGTKYFTLNAMRTIYGALAVYGGAWLKN